MYGRLWGVWRKVSRLRNRHTLVVQFKEGTARSFADLVEVVRLRQQGDVWLRVRYLGGKAVASFREGEVEILLERIVPKKFEGSRVVYGL